MPTRRLVLLCLLIVSVAGLAACGSSASDESQIEEAIETAASSSDPADCKKVQTQQFMEQVFKQEADLALEECEEGKEGDEDGREGVEKAVVTDVKVDGDKATAIVGLVGGAFDQQAVEIQTVKDGDQCKLDKIARIMVFNRRALIDFLTKELNEDSSEITGAQAGCIVEHLEDADDAELEKALLSSTTDAFIEIVDDCLPEEG